MKDFVKMTLAAILGCLVTGAVLTFIALGIIGSLAALGSPQPVMPREGILTIDMSKIVLAEQAAPADIKGMLEGETRASVGIWTAVRAIQEGKVPRQRESHHIIHRDTIQFLILPGICI